MFRRITVKNALLPIAFVLLTCSSQSSFAYNDDGHFYSVVSIANAHLPAYGGRAQEAAVLMAMCAQIPDLAKEYDAVSLRVRAIGTFTGSLWGMFSSCRGDDVCHMVAVHHYLHGLTGGNSQAVTDAATETLGDLLRRNESNNYADRNQICAAGFAIHLLGDSFSHRRLDSPDLMYPPGLGHFRNDQNPDFILYSEERSQNYVLYAQTLDRTLKSTSPATRWAQLEALLKQKRTDAQRGNRYNEKELRDAFRNSLKTAASDNTRIWAPYNPPLETANHGLVLSRTCKEALEQYNVQGVNCNKVWEQYKKAAVPAFAKQNIKPTCERLDDHWSDGVSPTD